jgi:predicted outer membrane repeat protein
MNKKFILILLIYLFEIFLLVLPTVSANDYIVENNSFSDIQGKIDISQSSGDRVLLGNYTYRDSGSSINITGNKKVTIQGKSNTSRATLNANNLQSILHIGQGSTVTIRYVNFVNSGSKGQALCAYGTVVVENCNFIGSQGSSGSAIYVNKSAPNTLIMNCEFKNNNANIRYGNTYADGGAVFINGADNTKIINCNFENNNAINNGGALAIRGSAQNVEITGCTFKNNKADEQGGAIYLTAAVTITNCIFIKNRANNNGGAIYIENNYLTIKSSTFNDNIAKSGGGIYSKGKIIIKNGCVFTNNKANNGNGGAIYSVNVLDITDSKFNSNKATNGGAIYNSNNLILSKANFMGNKATTNGGAIFSTNILNIISSSFTNNKAVNGGGIYSSKLTIDKCSFSSNIANSNGGALYSKGVTTIKNKSIFNNNKGHNGGAIFSKSNLFISSSSFTGNKATNGGVIYSSSGLTIDKSNFNSNQAKNKGGALYLNKATLIKGNSKFFSNSAYKGAAIFSNNKLTIFKSLFKKNKSCISLSISLKDKIVRYGKTKMIIKFESNNNVKSTNVNHAIWSNKVNKVKINGKVAKKYVLPSNTKLSIKINNKKTKIKSKIATVNIRTFPNYNWKDFHFKINYGGNSYINKTSTSYKVSARIVTTDVYNVDKNKKSKYYVPYRKDKLQTKINGKTYSKSIKQKASNNAYFLGGEKVSSDLQKFLAGWNGVVDVNESSIKKQTIVIFSLKSKAYGIKGKITPVGKTKSIQKWVFNNLKHVLNYDYGGSKILKDRKGNCAGYANLFVSLARTAGIPTSYLYMRPAGYNGITHVLTLVYIKNGNSWKVYKVEPQNSKFNYDPWKPLRMNDISPKLNYDVYGHELLFPHWYYERYPTYNVVRYLSSYDYSHPNYKKNAYLVL